MEKAATQRLHDAIANWIRSLDEYPGWREWNRKKVGKVLDHDDPFFGLAPSEPLGDFTFSPEVERQHSIALGFLRLDMTAMSLKDCEFYFRRYPFRNLPVSRHDHLNNMCEMYFSRFYEFKTRLKELMNLVNAATGRKLAVGELIKAFDKTFGPELRARNDIHHHARFSDIAIDKVALTHLVSKGDKGPRGWDREHLNAYRRATKEWANRVRERAKIVDLFVNAVAEAILSHCSFLGDLATPAKLTPVSS
jgi:hypothetical protein